MKTNVEIEFKTPLTETQYNDLIQLFELDNNIFKQTNFYFDSESLFFRKQKTVLRIRRKHNNYFKVTLKSHSDQGAFEQHVLLDEAQALSMIEHGFNTKAYFDIDCDVKLIGSLDNYRVSTPYKDGELFFDKIEYAGKVDYELEYEVDNYELGKKCFEHFLETHHIENRPALRKSERIYQLQP